MLCSKHWPDDGRDAAGVQPCPARYASEHLVVARTPCPGGRQRFSWWLVVDHDASLTIVNQDEPLIQAFNYNH